VDAIAAKYIDEERLTAEVASIVAQAEKLAVQYRRLSLVARGATVAIAPWPTIERRMWSVVEQIMHEHAGPMTLAEIIEAAEARGHILNERSIRSTLTRSPDATRVTRNTWTLTS
jgi:hypothetical protein